MEIHLTDEAFAGLGCEASELATEMRTAAAVKWYELGRVSQEGAADIAGVTRSEFIALLSRLKISPMQETADEASAFARLLLKA